MREHQRASTFVSPKSTTASTHTPHILPAQLEPTRVLDIVQGNKGSVHARARANRAQTQNAVFQVAFGSDIGDGKDFPVGQEQLRAGMLTLATPSLLQRCKRHS
jgi:hypothetical protein